MIFEMAKHGSVFMTRDRAISLFKDLEIQEAQAQAAGDHDLVLDFDQVSEVSLSFAETFIAWLFASRADRGYSQPELKDMNETISKMVAIALRDRPQVLASLSFA